MLGDSILELIRQTFALSVFLDSGAPSDRRRRPEPGFGAAPPRGQRRASERQQ